MRSAIRLAVTRVGAQIAFGTIHWRSMAPPTASPLKLLMFTFVYRNRSERVYKAVVAFTVCLQRVLFAEEALESKRLVERGGDSRERPGQRYRWRYRYK